MDWCIHTRPTLAASHSRTICSVVSGLVSITTPLTPAGVDRTSGQQRSPSQVCMCGFTGKTSWPVVAVVARHVRHGDAFLSEEVVHFGFESRRSHRSSCLEIRRSIDSIRKIVPIAAFVFTPLNGPWLTSDRERALC
jgi:hypothetical protein